MRAPFPPVRAAVAGLALAAAVGPASAQTATLGADGRTVRLSDLPASWAAALRDGSATAQGHAEGAGAPLAATVGADGTVVLRFPALPGVAHDLTLAAGGETLTLPVTNPPPPPAARVAGVWPGDAVLPENTLRLYLTFTRPMARGVTDHVRLEDGTGARLDDSFLNLATELWNADQTRLTLLLDPGRIKRGVGPNAAIGAPLRNARLYRLVVDAEARDAMGRPLDTAFAHSFSTGPAIRSAVDPAAWTISAPIPGTTAPLRVTFDRLMDRAISVRAMAVVDAEGRRVRGTVTATDDSWTLTPNASWSGTLRLWIDPVLEDVVGNTLCHPFDVEGGAETPCMEPVTRDLFP